MQIFVVVPGLNRHGMTANLLNDLADQGATTLLYDNGSTPPYAFAGCEVIPAQGWAFHSMWAHGMATARERDPDCHIAVLNNDLRVEEDFLLKLSLVLQQNEDAWITYPDAYGRGRTMATEETWQTITGYAFMIRGRSTLEPDQRFHFWYGDWDLEKQAQAAGKQVVTVAGCRVEHLEVTGSTRGERLEQAKRDEKEFAAKWGYDPSTLFLAQNPGWHEEPVSPTS